MLARLVHLSDLHVGAHDDGRATLEEAVRELVERRKPELVVATGDLTHRNRRSQHALAAAFLRSLAAPVVAIPGNHDLPPLPPRRVLAPFARFLEAWPETEPTHRSAGAVVVCLNSVRPWKYQRGALSDGQLEHAAGELASAPAGALRVVALHHHLATPPWRTGKRTVPRRSQVLARLADGRAELVLGGHTHQAIVIERREFMASTGGSGGIVLAGAPGLGRPRPSRHAEASGLNVIEADADRLRIETYAWSNGGLARVAERVYLRSKDLTRSPRRAPGAPAGDP